MSEPMTVTDHYSSGELLERIRAGFREIGKTPEDITVDDLGLVDEFHIGGRIASEHFLPQLNLSDKTHVLDIGCGIGGPARFTASRFGARVTGLDLTPEFVETGQELTRWAGLDQQVSLHRGSALEMPLAADSFDAAYMIHVGMNLPDKQALASEAARVLKPGAVFGIYDVMRMGDGDPDFPLPWASVPEISFVEPPARYKEVLEASGFEILSELPRKDFALEFFAEQRARAEAAGSPHPLGPQIVMGRIAPEKIRNLVAAISAGKLAPVELIARRGGVV